MFFPSTVTLNPYASEDSHHKITYGAPRSPKCKYAKVSKLITGSNNQQFMTCAWVQFPPGTAVMEKDKIVLPDSTTSPIVSLVRVKNPSDVEICVEVWLGEILKGGL